MRTAALKALGHAGDVACVPVLIKACSAKDLEEARMAGLALRMIKGAGVDAAILQWVSKADPPVKRELIAILADRRYGQAVPVLLAEANSDNATVADAALRALGQVGGEQDLPVLVKLLVEMKEATRRSEAERAVVRVAQKVPDPVRRSEPVLGALQTTRETAARCSLLRVLPAVASAKAYAVLAEAIQSSEAEVKETAIRVLAKWPERQAEPALLDLLKTSSNPTHRVLALRGLVRLIDQAGDRPARDKARWFGEVLACTGRPEDRRLVLSGLSRVPDGAALEVLAPCLEDTAVQKEAASAAVAIARQLSPAQAANHRAVLAKIASTVPDEGLRRQARSYLVPPSPDVFIDTLTPIRAKSGNAGGKVMIHRNCTGAPLRLKGVTYARGIGEHATAELIYRLRPEYRKFVALVGLDDQVGRFHDVRGSSVVKVYLDDKLVAQTRVLRGAGDWSALDVEIPRGAGQLRLVVDDAGDGVDFDDLDFVDAGFLKD